MRIASSVSATAGFAKKADAGRSWHHEVSRHYSNGVSGSRKKQNPNHADNPGNRDRRLRGDRDGVRGSGCLEAGAGPDVQHGYERPAGHACSASRCERRARGTSDQSVALTEADVEAIQNEVPTVKVASPVVNSSAQIIAGNQNWQTRVEGANERYLEIRDWKIDQGSFFAESDVKSAARVIVLGKTVAVNLFGDADPIGQTIRVRNLPYRIVGVLAAKGQSAMGTDQDDVAMMPYTTVQKKMQGQAILSINRASVSAIDADSTSLAQAQIADLLR